MVGEDRLLERDALGDPHRRRLPGDRPVLVVELDLDALLGVGDPAERVDEVHVPRRAAELAVGGRLQADLLLLAHDVADGVVLDGAQLVGAQAPGGVLVSRARELGGSQERADVVGAERGAGPGGHAVSSSSDRWASSTSRRLRGARPVRSCTAVLTTSQHTFADGRAERGVGARRSAGRPTATRSCVAALVVDGDGLDGAAGDLGHQRGELRLRDELGARDVVDAVLVAVGGEHRGRGRGAVLARDVGRARRRRCCARAGPTRRRAPPRATWNSAYRPLRSAVQRRPRSRIACSVAPCSWATTSGSAPPAFTPEV